MWAHAEYLKLLRSLHDGRIFDRIDEVYDRYARGDSKRRLYEIWSFKRQPKCVIHDTTLRILAHEAFRLHWSNDNWQSIHETESSSPGLNIHFVDIEPKSLGQESIVFTFWWSVAQRWEDEDFRVSVAHRS